MRGKILLVLVLIFYCDLSAQKRQCFIFDAGGLNANDKLTALTIAGIVNRDTAQLYLKGIRQSWSYSLADSYYWIEIYKEYGNAQFEFIYGIDNLINKYKYYFAGAIVYDTTKFFSNFDGQNFLWQGEVAAMIGALTNRIPLSMKKAQGLGLNIVDSVIIIDHFGNEPATKFPAKLNDPLHIWNSNSYTNEQQYYKLLDTAIKYILPRCNPFKISNREITDYYVKERMFMINVGATEPDGLDFSKLLEQRAKLIEDCLKYLSQKNPNKIKHFYGWINPEPLVQWISAYGFSFHEANVPNMSFHSSYPIPENFIFENKSKQLSTEDTILSNKYYVLILGSEGDACNWVNTFQAGAWLSPKRGKIPVNWGWNLHIFEDCPFLAYYNYSTATKNDGFVSVLSPLGYIYVDVLPNGVINDAIEKSRYLMNKYNVDNIYGYKHYCGQGTCNYRGITIRNNYVLSNYANFQKSIDVKLTLVFEPLLPNQQPKVQDGHLFFNHAPAYGSGDVATFYANAYSGPNDITIFADRITNYLKTKTKPFFMLGGYQRYRQDNNFSSRTDPSYADVNLTMLEQMYNKVKSDATIGNDVEFVTIEKFSYLLRKHLNLPVDTENNNLIIEKYAMYAYPNPFNPATNIIVKNIKSGNYTIDIYNILGQKVYTLYNGYLEKGNNKFIFNANNFASGIYFVKFIGDNINLTYKLLLQR